MAIIDSAPDFRIGRVVSRTFDVLRRNAPAYLLASVVLLCPTLALTLFTGSSNYVTVFRSHGVLLGFASLILPLICSFLLQAALVRATLTDLNGEKPGLGESLSSAWGMVASLAAMFFLKYLGMGMAFVLLIVPGIMLAMAWFVTVPVLVAEQTGISETFGRSRELTKGHRWKLFVLALMYVIVSVPLTFLVALVSRVNLLSTTAQNAPGILFLVLSWIMGTILATVTATGISVIYFELRTAREGLAPEQLLRAFD